jgi:excisionase family DNA binding protein
MTAITDERRLSPEEVADLWNVPVKSVHQMLRRGELDGFKVREKWRIRPDEVARFEREGARR